MTTILQILGAFSLLASAQSESAVDPYEFEKARAEVVRGAVNHVLPSIVTIETIGGAQPLTKAGPRGPREEAFRLADGPTTGVVLTSDGLIITSSFNFAREPAIITVTLSDGRRAVARLLARDHIRRLALIKVDETGLPLPEWVAQEELRVGQFAISCGRALGGSQPSISLGIVSALNRRNGNAVQTDAKVSPVNYGGPLIDIDGRIIGILVPMAGSGGALAGAQWYDSGIGFAIYKTKVDFVIDRLAAGESIEQGKIGIILEPDEPSILPLLDKIFPAAKGVKIKEVAEYSPASRAGLRPGDKILAIDEQPTGDLMELQRRLSDRAAGEEITLTVKRRWRKLTVKLELIKADQIGIATPEDEEGSDEMDGAEEDVREEPSATTKPVDE